MRDDYGQPLRPSDEVDEESLRLRTSHESIERRHSESQSAYRNSEGDVNTREVDRRADGLKVTGRLGDDDEEEDQDEDEGVMLSQKEIKEVRTFEIPAMIACCLSIFVAGAIDGSLGPLIPAFQEYYQVGYTPISILFIVLCVGFLSGAMSGLRMTQKFGFGITLFFGGAIQLLAFLILSLKPPLWIMIMVYGVIGVATAFQDGQNNSIVTLMSNADVKMGILHAMYGTGALISPIFATYITKEGAPRFSSVYKILAVIGVINCLAVAAVFRGKRVEDLLPAQQSSRSDKRIRLETSEESHRPEAEQDQMPEGEQNMATIIKMPIIQLLGFFLLAYVGLEITIGGWIVTYLLKERGGGANSGYTSSGFFGGLTAGRLILIPVTRKLTEERAVFTYLLIAACFQIVVWMIPNFYIDAIAVTLIGVFIGPIYPIVMQVIGRTIHPSLMTGAVGFISSVGAAGGAAFPFLTGAMASKFTIRILPLLVLVIIGFNLVSWVPIVRMSRAASASASLPAGPR